MRPFLVLRVFITSAVVSRSVNLPRVISVFFLFSEMTPYTVAKKEYDRLLPMLFDV